jgi:hypothetical protein
MDIENVPSGAVAGAGAGAAAGWAAAVERLASTVRATKISMFLDSDDDDDDDDSGRGGGKRRSAE